MTDAELICQLHDERLRLIAEAQELERQANALSDFQIGQKFGISAIEVRDVIRAHRPKARLIA